jgi:hypothetical protein
LGVEFVASRYKEQIDTKPRIVKPPTDIELEHKAVPGVFNPKNIVENSPLIASEQNPYREGTVWGLAPYSGTRDGVRLHRFGDVEAEIRADHSRYDEFAVSGTFQQGYAFSGYSFVEIDKENRLRVNPYLTIIAPDGSTETFSDPPSHQDGDSWQWDGTGSKRGSLTLKHATSFFSYLWWHSTNAIYTRSGFPAVSSVNTTLTQIKTQEHLEMPHEMP